MERITPRYIFEARIQISAQRDSEHVVMEGWTRDMSETGLSAFVARSLTVGEIVTVEIPLAASRRLHIPARVARCLGTQYGFQFTALSHEQRASLQSAVANLPEADVGDQFGGATLRKHHAAPTTGVSTLERASNRDPDTAFADRARALIKRGYTPKVAVDLVLHELQVEHGDNSRLMDKARSDAEEFLFKLRRGLI
jgi:hypothetical protein